MAEEPTHRKLVKHYDVPSHLRELTFSCYRRLPLLRHRECCELLAASIEVACKHHEVQLLAYVFMPEHVHLLVHPCREDMKIQDFLSALKRPMSVRAKKVLMARDPDFCQANLIVQERPGKKSFRFWQEGPGYDRNLYRSPAILSVIDYIHANSVRRGLCEYEDQWPWTSWHAYHPSDAPLGPPTVHTDWIL